MLNIMGQMVKPRGLWLTRSTANGDVISCNVCGYILESSCSSEAMYNGEDGTVVKETVELFFPTKYCPQCHSRLLNWRMMDLGDI